MNLLLILVPVFLAGLALVLPSNRWRPLLLPLAGTVNLALVITILIRPDQEASFDWLGLDPLSRLLLLSVTGLYFFCAFYGLGYLRHRLERPNRIFVSCMLGFLSLVSLAIQARHLGLVWVAMEGTTLVAAPLIYFNNTRRSIEATWKYLLVGSVGIALALLGTFFLAWSADQGGLSATMSVDQLSAMAGQLSRPWLQAAFVLLLVGYGTKMGLAPMHTWKPDAYGESPGVVGALFAGGTTTAAFLALLRVYRICLAAGLGAWCQTLLLCMGLGSMAVAGLFMLGQRDFKRLLAYSSVEHMGILIFGLGLGPVAFFGTLLHVLNNTMGKGVLFLAAGNIHRAYASKHTSQVRGAWQRLPVSGTLFFLGFLAVTGSPPFATFVSEFSILLGAFGAGHYLAGALFLVLLLVVFLGMGKTVLTVVLGRVPEDLADTGYRDGWLTAAPPVLLMALVLVCGLWLPPAIRDLVQAAAAYLGGAA